MIASFGVGLVLRFRCLWLTCRRTISWTDLGIFILYEPVKTLSKIHIVMQRSIGASTQIFALMDSEPTIQRCPDAIDASALERKCIEFDHVTFRYPTARRMR